MIITNKFIGNGETRYFSRSKVLDKGFYTDGKYIYYNGNVIIDTKDIKLRGVHNYENICTALNQLTALDTPTILGMVLVVIGLAIKSGLFPFHFWMPDAYGCATPTSSSLLSGMVTKGYILLLINFYIFHKNNKSLYKKN